MKLPNCPMTLWTNQQLIYLVHLLQRRHRAEKRKCTYMERKINSLNGKIRGLSKALSRWSVGKPTQEKSS